MTVEDVPAVQKIDMRSMSLYWSESAYRYNIEKNPASRCWVAESEVGEIAGFLVTWLIIDEMHIATFAVDPDHRRQGIGYALLSNGLELTWSEGARVSFLEVREGNTAAIALYTKCGYKYADIRRDYYQDNHESALMLNLDTEDFRNFVTKENIDE